MTIAIRNRSSSACVLRGIPALAFFETSRRRSFVPVCANCDDYLFRVQPVTDIVVEPNSSAYVVVGFDIEDGAGPCRNAARLNLYLPNNRSPLRFSVIQGRDRMRSCGQVDITPFLGKPPANGFSARTADLG